MTLLAAIDVEFIAKLVTEAGVVGAIAITVIRFLLTRLIKQFDDAEEERKRDHRQLLTWFASFTRTMLVWEKQFLLHDATVHGINPSTGETVDERMLSAQRKFDSLDKSFSEAISKIDEAIRQMEREAR